MSAVETPIAAASTGVSESPATFTPSSSTAIDKQKEKAAKAKKKKKEKSKKKPKKPKKNTLKTKIVVRRLPPNLPEGAFMDAVKRCMADEAFDYKLYVPGKISQSKGKENTFSRAYFHMKSMEGVIEFHQAFDGHIFIDGKGTEHRAVVEFAPYQKLPKAHKNPDLRQGTIDEDPDYLKFVESLKEAEKNPMELKDVGEGGSQLERLENRLAHVTAQNLAAEQANKPTTTPLLDHLRAKKAAEAASKAKAQAAKAAKKKAAKAEAKKKEKEAAKANGEEGAPAPAKKPTRNRNRKKKEEKEGDGEAKPKEEGNKKKGKAPNNKDPNAKPDKPKKPRPKKDKEAKGKQVDKQDKQQTVSILGRQQPGDNKPKTQQQQQRAG